MWSYVSRHYCACRVYPDLGGKGHGFEHAQLILFLLKTDFCYITVDVDTLNLGRVHVQDEGSNLSSISLGGYVRGCLIILGWTFGEPIL